MGKLLISDHGKLRNADDLELAEKIFDTKQDYGHWAVIEELLKAWAKRAPDEEQALKVELEDHRDLLADKKFGTTSNGKDIERRFTLVFPGSLQLLIRSVYKADELPFDKPFYAEFARRFPFFKVAEEV